ncbi:MAG: APC family permease [Gammaproteobacteria bacterium]
MYKSGTPIGFWSAVLLGVGAMVGAGIFALLGQAGAMVGSAVWISFVYGGVIAALSAYSLGRLGARYPSAGGLVEYLVQAYGGGVVSGTGATLLYLAGLLALTLIAKAFGSYGCELMIGSTEAWLVNLLAIAVVAAFTAVNLRGAGDVAKVENVVVVSKVSVLVAFIVIGAFYIVPSRLDFADYPREGAVLASVGITFFAYEGFRVITNTAEDMADPARQLPRAIMVAIAIVGALYIALSLVVFGNLDVGEAVAAKDYALARAAAPVFGMGGFTIVVAAALVSTASAINANLYAITNVSYQMAKDGELPAAFGAPIAHSREGLLISAAIVAILVLALDLTSLAVIGSLTILLVHITVHIGHLRIAKETGASKGMVALAIAANLAVVAAVVDYEIAGSPATIVYLVGFVVTALLLEVLVRTWLEREIAARSDGSESTD